MVGSSILCHRCGNVIPERRVLFGISTALKGYLLPFHSRCWRRQLEDDHRAWRRRMDRDPAYADWYKQQIHRAVAMMVEEC
jgi:hypothetical protein